jgi:hypothetical protein
MSEVFSPTFDKLYEQIFKRFRLAKYEIKQENYKLDTTKEKDCLYVAEISNDDKEIDIFEISVALALFMKNEFKEKIQLLFDITDVDGDGYINQTEIKNIITVSFYIFSDEECSLPTNSSIVNHSLATLKAQQVMDKLFYYVIYI